MTFVKRTKSKFKLLLRRMGLLCNKNTKPKKTRIRVSRSINVDGTVTEYTSPLEKLPENPNSFESELHVWNEIHKPVTKTNDK